MGRRGARGLPTGAPRVWQSARRGFKVSSLSENFRASGRNPAGRRYVSRGMKTLLLLRHAKSSWKIADQPDFERPLNGRGERAAPLMGRHLRQQKIEPDLILCSPAERARQTAALFTSAAKIGAELRYDERIYEASALQLLEVVTQADEAAETLMLVGHNPGMEELILLLTGETRLMPTAALAKIDLSPDKWAKVKEQTGRLDWIVKPKDLDEEA